ncbi:MBL fold metallo-hydrolase [Lutibacter maritimus]|uniref:Phosphoribosyl 1,2-cyclic phosphodiesterase n=1 Tax=Lutibacter maritimus TaxID=593133 RepID=A0A1I6NRB4_9FLAO|nr:MBL fold metallo-hydrolase [Lutibacter maritimus]SFS30457.1 Phosphoribosyl 1,2-cyclic phosphodiesterase [Lutibacter maritimus]
MKLKVIGTGSKGNCYLLENENEALIIEAGVNIQSIKQALNFNVSKVAGCIVSHEHMDHAKSIEDLLKVGINTYASKATFKALKIENHRAIPMVNKGLLTIGNFKVMPFDVQHDAAEPFGFIIKHNDCGNVLFLTDTFYCAYTFKNLNNIIIEANFSQKIIDAKMRAGATPEFLRNRILKSHLSLENCLEALSKNDLSKVNNIVLIHLSDSNSNEVEFQKTVEKATQKTVTVANNGISINFNKTPF